MGDIDINRLRELLAKATPGPWEWNARRDICDEHESYLMPADVFIDERLPHADADLIVEAINALPALLDRIKELEAERDTLQARLAAVEALPGKWRGKSYNRLFGAVPPEDGNAAEYWDDATREAADELEAALKGERDE